MLNILQGLPEDVLGIEAIGIVTHQDYQTVLIPAAEERIAKGPLNMLFAAGPQFTGYALDAMWDDSAFGLKHWTDFKRVAVATDNPWLRAAVTMFSPFFPCEVHLYPYRELDGAKEWVSGAA